MDAVGFLQRKRPFPLRETSFSFKGNFGFLCAALCASRYLQGGFCSGAGAADEETVGPGEILKISKSIDIFQEIPYAQSVKRI